MVKLKVFPAWSVFRLAFNKDWLKPVQTFFGLFLVLFGIILFFANPYGMRFVSSIAFELEELRVYAPILVLAGALLQIRRLYWFISSSLIFAIIFFSLNRFESREFQMISSAPSLESEEHGVTVKIWHGETEIFSSITATDYSEASLWASYRAVRRVAAYLRNKNDKKILAVLDLPFSRGARLYSIFGEVSRLQGFKDGKKIAYSNF